MPHPRLQVIISRSQPSRAHLSAAFTARRHSSSLWPPSQRSLHRSSSSTRGQHTISHITFSNIPTISTVLRAIACTISSSSRGRPLTSQTCSRRNLRATAIISTMVLTIVMAMSFVSPRSQVRSRATTRCSRNRINSSLNSQYQLCLTTKRHLE